ncbi:T9SS type A sorting domain-containing protein [Parabacteroides sp. Marseille-P3160]|uniref:T9SS type A sorting domain-containing protein n=1 Tax=Parabacteroides sp. Marseille-P3160 TaxID=1917887 RepID=UPI0009BBD165|nr:T9SS type A sorting domain-containing protein [Parabacteroides sp. Marseille-P3160]
MKTKLFLFLLCAFAIDKVIAQTVPEQWATFVNSEDNYLLSDTFRFQGFESSPEDNWGYTVSNSDSISIFDASKAGIKRQGGKHSIRMRLNSWIKMDSFPTNVYKSHKMFLIYGSDSLMMGERLDISFIRNGQRDTIKFMDIKANNTTYSYKNLGFKDNPISFQLITTNPIIENSLYGYCCIDSLLVEGQIENYSLFTGEGDWNDTIRWSHLPPARHRSALVKGKITVSQPLSCQSILLNEGSIRVNSSLQTDSLAFYGDNISFASSGEVHIRKAVTYQKTFPEKGKWYFVSFPFDVYPSGIDTAFTLKDEKESAGGNYFYIQEYNSEQRAQNGNKTSNWKVIPTENMEKDDEPLFKKNTGYLIALDAASDRQTITFSATSVPSSFATEGSIPINPGFGKNPKDNGWYLCGNPFPHPLALRQLAGNDQLEPSVWVYDGAGYQPFPMESDYALPPFSAFFVKAKNQTELVIPPETVSTENSILISTQHSLNDSRAEPVATGQIPSPSIKVYYLNGSLHWEGITESSRISVLDMNGRILFSQRMDSEDLSIPLPLLQGIYFFSADNKSRVIHQKFRVGE